MALQRPYITDKFTSYEGDKIFTDLSIALWLIDDYTGEEPVGPIKVIIKKSKIKGFKNLSGYYIFTDLADGNYTVDIESDFYFNEESIIDTSMIKILDTVILEFESVGSLKGKTSAQLKDVSKLQKDYVVEFRNPKGETEQKSIIELDPINKEIKWRKGLKKHFSAFLFTWGNVPDNNEEKERFLNFLKDDLDVGWVKDADIRKIDENTIHISKEEDSLEITLDKDNEEVTIKIKDNTYTLRAKKENGNYNIYGSTVRALSYVAGIILKPKSSYPFSDRANLVRGSIVSIVDSNKIPVNNAIIKVIDHEIETKSDENGEFVLYFREFKIGQIQITVEKNGIHKSKSIALVGREKVFMGEIIFP
jgi:hypothetical protein